MASTYVFLNVHDLEKSLEWYRALGFKVTETFHSEDGRPRYAELDLQGAEIGLGEISANDDPDFRSWVKGDLGAGVMVTFHVPNAQRYWNRAQEARMVVDAPLADRPYGRTFLLNDPNGYVISFLEERRGAKKAKGAKKTAKRGRKATVARTRKASLKGAKKAAKKGRGKSKRATGRGAKAKKTARRGRS